MKPDTTQPEVAIELDVYEPPRVEAVLSADDLAREIQYAGITTIN